MSGFQRYAIYHLPDEARLAEFGASWLGWNVETGESVDTLPGAGDPSIVASPRKYGFHGTLKPPFRLADGRHVDDLAADLATFSARSAPITTGGLRLARIGGFLALVPSGDTEGLSALAFSLVRDFDAYRRPADDAEIARRRRAGLTPRQDAYLLEWGYPYVGEDFRFHLTLSGRLDGATLDETETWLADHLPPLAPTFDVASVALVGEEDTGQFRLIHRYALTG